MAYKKRDKGAIEILCDEIDFRFHDHLERVDLLVSFVSVLVDNVASMRGWQERIFSLTGVAPSSESQQVLDHVQKMLLLVEKENLITEAAQINMSITISGNEEACPCDHLIDMLSSCTSAIQFGLKDPCHSRHAASAANHIWKRKYGVTLFDRYTSNWSHDWTRAQLQLAISKIAFPGVDINEW